jgi:hypothetical protein
MPQPLLGAHQPLKTTKASLSQLTLGLDWSSIPKTFQDAITLTRSLGIDYIWIDSLCII